MVVHGDSLDTQRAAQNDDGRAITTSTDRRLGVLQSARNGISHRRRVTPVIIAHPCAMMRRMKPRFTLDTGCVIAVVRPEQPGTPQEQLAAIARLIELARAARSNCSSPPRTSVTSTATQATKADNGSLSGCGKRRSPPTQLAGCSSSASHGWAVPT